MHDFALPSKNKKVDLEHHDHHFSYHKNSSNRKKKIPSWLSYISKEKSLFVFLECTIFREFMSYFKTTNFSIWHVFFAQEACWNLSKWYLQLFALKERNPFFNSTKPQTFGKKEREKEKIQITWISCLEKFFVHVLYFISIFSFLLFLKQVNITSQKTYQKEWKLLDHASMSVCSVSAYTIVFPLEMD